MKQSSRGEPVLRRGFIFARQGGVDLESRDGVRARQREL